MCLRSLEFGMSAKEWSAGVEGVETALSLLLFGGWGIPEPAEARPGICKPVDWGSAGTKIASAILEGAPSSAAWGTFLLEWAN